MTSVANMTNSAQLATAIHTTIGTNAGTLMPQYVPLMSNALEQPRPLVQMPHLDGQVVEPPAESPLSLHLDAEHIKSVLSSILRNEPLNGIRNDSNAMFHLDQAVRSLVESDEPDVAKAITKLGGAANYYESAGQYPAAAILSEISAMFVLKTNDDLSSTIAAYNLRAAWNWYQTLLRDLNPVTFDWGLARALQNASLAESLITNPRDRTADECIRTTMWFATRFHRGQGKTKEAAADLLYLVWRITRKSEDKLSIHEWINIEQTLSAAVRIFNGDASSADIFMELRGFADAAQTFTRANQA